MFERLLYQLSVQMQACKKQPTSRKQLSTLLNFSWSKNRRKAKAQSPQKAVPEKYLHTE
jgi:hypothetical protein